MAEFKENLINQHMAFSIQNIGEIDRIVGRWCLEQVPPEIKNQIDHDYEIDGQSVTIFEVRPLWRGHPGEFTRRPFAKFRYVKSSELWHIYWMRQTGKWHTYEPDSVARNLKSVLNIIQLDNYGCFFG